MVQRLSARSPPEPQAENLIFSVFPIFLMTFSIAFFVTSWPKISALEVSISLLHTDLVPTSKYHVLRIFKFDDAFEYGRKSSAF